MASATLGSPGALSSVTPMMPCSDLRGDCENLLVTLWGHRSLQLFMRESRYRYRAKYSSLSNQGQPIIWELQRTTEINNTTRPLVCTLEHSSDASIHSAGASVPWEWRFLPNIKRDCLRRGNSTLSKICCQSYFCLLSDFRQNALEVSGTLAALMFIKEGEKKWWKQTFSSPPPQDRTQSSASPGETKLPALSCCLVRFGR